jgi:hypothetical protein
LRELRLQALLARDQLVHARLKFNDLSRDRARRRWSEQAAAERSREHGGPEK